MPQSRVAHQPGPGTPMRDVHNKDESVSGEVGFGSNLNPAKFEREHPKRRMKVRLSHQDPAQAKRAIDDFLEASADERHAELEIMR
jgi:hypothetical protein